MAKDEDDDEDDEYYYDKDGNFNVIKNETQLKRLLNRNIWLLRMNLYLFSDKFTLWVENIFIKYHN